MNRLKVGFLASQVVWTPGGSFRVMFEYANRLSQRGHEVHIVFPILLSQGIIHIVRSLTKSWGQILGWFPLDRKVRVYKILGTQQRPWAKLPNVDVWVGLLPLRHVILWLKSQEKPFAIFVQSAKEVPAAQACDAPLIAVSSFLWEKLCRNRGEVYLLPNGVDTQIFRPTIMPTERPYTVGMAYVPRGAKDPETGLKALQIIKEQKPDVKVILFGPTRKPPSLPYDITFYSRVPAYEMPGIYNQCLVFISSSREEGFCLPVLEAMACGCAVVTTDSGGVRDFARHEENALVVPPGDARALADGILRVLTNSELRLRLVKQGLETAKRMDWPVQKLETILGEILTR